MSFFIEGWDTLLILLPCSLGSPPSPPHSCAYPSPSFSSQPLVPADTFLNLVIPSSSSSTLLFSSSNRTCTLSLLPFRFYSRSFSRSRFLTSSYSSPFISANIDRGGRPAPSVSEYPLGHLRRPSSQPKHSSNGSQLQGIARYCADLNLAGDNW